MFNFVLEYCNVYICEHFDSFPIKITRVVLSTRFYVNGLRSILFFYFHMGDTRRCSIYLVNFIFSLLQKARQQREAINA